MQTPDWKFYHLKSERLMPLFMMVGQIRAHDQTPRYYIAMLEGFLRGALNTRQNCGPIMLRDASLSDSQCNFVEIWEGWKQSALFLPWAKHFNARFFLKKWQFTTTKILLLHPQKHLVWEMLCKIMFDKLLYYNLHRTKNHLRRWVLYEDELVAVSYTQSKIQVGSWNRLPRNCSGSMGSISVGGQISQDFSVILTWSDVKNPKKKRKSGQKILIYSEQFKSIFSHLRYVRTKLEYSDIVLI